MMNIFNQFSDIDILLQEASWSPYVRHVDGRCEAKMVSRPGREHSSTKFSWGAFQLVGSQGVWTPKYPGCLPGSGPGGWLCY